VYFGVADVYRLSALEVIAREIMPAADNMA